MRALLTFALFTWVCQAQIHVNACTSQDAGYIGGTCYTSPIALPAGAPAYDAQERYGNFSYHFPTTDGQFTVGMHFIENSTAISGTGQRQFSVSINGAAALTNFDLAMVSPLNTPVDRSFTTVAAGGGGITIVFTTVIRNAVVSAIDVSPVPVNPFPGCLPNGRNGITCQGGFDLPPSQNAGVVLLGGVFGLAFPPTAGTPIINLMPPGDGTGKFPKDSGVVPCPPLDPSVTALLPVCHQWVWQALVPSVLAANPGDLVGLTLQQIYPGNGAGIRQVQDASGNVYYLVDQSGNK